jgi:hypothetical protein
MPWLLPKSSTATERGLPAAQTAKSLRSMQRSEERSTGAAREPGYGLGSLHRHEGACLQRARRKRVGEVLLPPRAGRRDPASGRHAALGHSPGFLHSYRHWAGCRRESGRTSGGGAAAKGLRGTDGGASARAAKVRPAWLIRHATVSSRAVIHAEALACVQRQMEMPLQRCVWRVLVSVVAASVYLVPCLAHTLERGGPLTHRCTAPSAV